MRTRFPWLFWLLAFVAVATLPAGALALVGVERAYTPIDHSRLVHSGRHTVDAHDGLAVSAFELNAGPYAGSPEQQARAFLTAENAALGLALDGVALELVTVKQGPWQDAVRFRQTVGGVPVLHSDVVVTVRRADGVVRSVMSRVYPAAAAVALAPGLSEQSARDLAVAHLEATEERIGDESVSLALLPRATGAFPLVYRVIIPAGQPLGDWEVLVDASSGEVLRVTDQAVYATGTGLSFDPDPLTTARVDYGVAGYTDANDTDVPQLNAERFVRTLLDITLTGQTYRLEGPYCRIQNFENPPTAPVTSNDPNGFHFLRSHPGFEDVMVYWGIDMSQRYIQSLGFFNIQNNQIACDPHGVNGDDNSHYVPSSNRLAWGEGGVDDAEDMDVILHEYGHAIQHGSVPGWFGQGESGAMGEGFGDYWAASYSATQSDYRSNWVFNWDGHNEFWSGRVIDYPNHYPEGLRGLIHTDGQMWSSTLWQVYNETCREMTDRNTLDHHFGMGQISLMRQAAQSWVQSDRELHDGLNVDTFVHFATARGFFLPLEYPVPVITHTPLGNKTDSGPYVVTATVTSDSAITGVELRYGNGGAIDQSVALAPTGNPNEWSGEIPSQPNGTVRYFLVATNSADYKATHPRPAPCGPVHEFQVNVVVAVGEGAGAALRLAPSFPNPFTQTSTVRFTLGEAGPVRVAVYGVDGAQVRELSRARLEAGEHALNWDGRDGGGRRVAAGTYYVRVETAAGSASGKLVVLP